MLRHQTLRQSMPPQGQVTLDIDTAGVAGALALQLPFLCHFANDNLHQVVPKKAMTEKADTKTSTTFCQETHKPNEPKPWATGTVF